MPPKKGGKVRKWEVIWSIRSRWILPFLAVDIILLLAWIVIIAKSMGYDIIEQISSLIA